MRNLPFLIAIALIAVLGTLGILIATGIVHLPGFGKPTGPRPGEVALIVTRAPLPAYTKITRDTLVDPKTKVIPRIYYPKKELPTGAIVEMRDIVGRVLKRDKAQGYAFSEEDFLPDGTRPGIVAGIPPGMRAVTVEQSRIKGLQGLNVNDHFDLVTVAPSESEAPAATAAPMVVSPSSIARAANSPKGGYTMVLVNDGMIVRGPTTRQETYERKSGLVGTNIDIKSKPVVEITIAVPAPQLGAISAALLSDQSILALARSGAAGADKEGPLVINHPVRPTPVPTPEPTKVVKPPTIETIVGSNKSHLVFDDKKE